MKDIYLFRSKLLVDTISLYVGSKGSLQLKILVVFNTKTREGGRGYSELLYTRILKFNSPVLLTCHMSHVTCHVSCVTCHVSHITFFFLTIWWCLLVEGLLSTGPTLSIFLLVSKKKGFFCSFSVFFFSSY